MENNYLIYELIDNDNKPFYIGKTKNLKQRMYEHWRLATKRNGQYYICKKIRKLISEYNYELKWNILFNNLSSDEAIELEIKTIKEFKDKGIKLTNLTDGGDGISGAKRIFTEEWKNNLKEAKKKQYEEKYVQPTKGKTYEEIYGILKSEEIKNKVKNTFKEGLDSGRIKMYWQGKKLEEVVGEERAKELKKQISERTKIKFTGIKQSEEHKLKRLKNQSITKKNWNEEQKKAQSERSKLAAEASIKRNNIKITLLDNKEIIIYASYIETSKYLLENYNIKINPVSISKILRNKIDYTNTKHKYNFIFV